MVRSGKAWYGGAWSGMVWFGLYVHTHAYVLREGMARSGKVWQGMLKKLGKEVEKL